MNRIIKIEDPKLKIGDRIKFENSRRIFELQEINYGIAGIPEDPAGASYMFIGPGNMKEYFTKKTWKQAISKGWIIKV
jgi:hypothetical protein